MAHYDFRAPRLFVAAELCHGACVALDAGQRNYLTTVLRLRPGDLVLIFNGRDGEWRATLSARSRRDAALVVGEQTRPQTAARDLHYLFAPLKQARLDYMVQKAVEMGASRLQPVLTQHGQVARVNAGRMRANAIEAAEQCGILGLPDIAEPIRLSRAIADFAPRRLLVFCDEEADIADPVAALARFRADRGEIPLAVLIGPEGGFSAEERTALMALPRIVRLSLGPRILRADTAAVAALALVNAVLGDWR